METKLKKQKICHDNSCPPYDSFCSYCSRSMGCDSEDFRMVEESEPDEMHIDEIKAAKKLADDKKKEAVEFADYLGYRFHKIDRSDRWYPMSGYQYPSYGTDEIYDAFLKWKKLNNNQNTQSS